jgi:hypothetical protein
MEAPKTTTYILERTPDFFVGRPTSPARGLHAWSLPTRGLLFFDLPPQWRRRAPLTAWGLPLRPLQQLGLVLGPR